MQFSKRIVIDKIDKTTKLMPTTFYKQCSRKFTPVYVDKGFFKICYRQKVGWLFIMLFSNTSLGVSIGLMCTSISSKTRLILNQLTFYLLFYSSVKLILVRILLVLITRPPLMVRYYFHTYVPFYFLCCNAINTQKQIRSYN